MKNILLWITALLFLVAVVSSVSASIPSIQSTRDYVIYGDDASSNSFYLVINGYPNTRYDIRAMINGDSNMNGVQGPHPYGFLCNENSEGRCGSTPIVTNFSWAGVGRYAVTTDSQGFSSQLFIADINTVLGTYTYSISTYGNEGYLPANQATVEILATPPPKQIPSVGTITVESTPIGATIFLDNAIKGITPLTINSVPNGDHVILLRLQGYQDSSNSISVLGDNQTINPTLTPTNVPTTGIITTQITTIATTATPRPTATINYSATIADLQSQIAEQNAKIEEQGSWIDQILRFLGLK